MKYDSQAFPYPILSHDQVDYPDFTDSAFQCSLNHSLSDDESQLVVSYKFILSNDAINSLIECGKASFAIEVVCTETLLRKIYFLDQEGSINLPASSLYGEIEFSPIVVIRVSGTMFTSDDLNPEFAGKTFELNAGDFIALDNSSSCFLNCESLKFDTLVSYDYAEDVNDFHYRFDFEGDKIRILVGEKLKNLMDKFCGDSKLKHHLVTSVYKDCVLFALMRMVEKHGGADNYKWRKSLNIKLNEMGIDITRYEKEFEKLNEVAQEILEEIGVKKLYAIHLSN